MFLLLSVSLRKHWLEQLFSGKLLYKFKVYRNNMPTYIYQAIEYENFSVCEHSSCERWNLNDRITQRKENVTNKDKHKN